MLLHFVAFLSLLRGWFELIEGAVCIFVPAELMGCKLLFLLFVLLLPYLLRVGFKCLANSLILNITHTLHVVDLLGLLLMSGH